ncbi:N-formylglutamate amidohydrolase [Haliangium ochraceum]|uniref:N-formylglutamate amidohydrolase n=1 Tax=Haliangium ochraceum (strain DSM 14365 / JCM 11303 / SMP-2) TaxID=502025 RepID=D0LHB4_HALO1|nr:N-formylglutamate amidohydrolase [Haliangium ochraceum]ACY18259.1 N-formylglutamate amidohydrolase [Haliangium ochraceum DSM 14365]
MRPESLRFSCEHASARVPAAYAACFRGAEQALASHRGSDLGAAWFARWLARHFAAPLRLGEVSRLLVDLNRSAHHPRVFSSWSRALPAAERERVLARYYHPYRDAIAAEIASDIAAGRRVVHVSVHSFTPVLDEVVRTAEIGLLYDPARPHERALCAAWKQALGESAPALRVRRNYPYRGAADGFTTSLRKRFVADDYLGVEIELSQALSTGSAAARQALAETVAATLRAARSA